MDYTQTSTWRRPMAMCFLLGCIGIVACAVAVWPGSEILWRAYLLGYMTWWAVAMGGAGLVALGNLTGGRWAEAARPFYLAAMGTLPILALLFIPLAFGLAQIYPWGNPNTAEHLGFSRAKAAYLSPAFFLSRAAVYFVIWILVVRWLASVSQFNRRPAGNYRMRRAGALSLVLLVPTATFAAFDWSMSLEPLWYSSIYGAIITAGGVVAMQALAIVSTALAPRKRSDDQPTADVLSGHPYDEEQSIYRDLANLQLAFIMVWTYFSFSQFLIIWYGNLPSEITWYLRRLNDGWQYVAIAIVLLCFVVPFAALFSRELKRSIGQLSPVGLLLLVAYGLNMFWTIVPAWWPTQGREFVAYAAAIVGVGGIWLTMYFFGLSRLKWERVKIHEEHEHP
jgi:hypothetical protein